VFEDVGSLGLGLLLLVPSFALTTGALWIAARLTPWFLKQRLEPPTVRSFFLDIDPEAELTQARMTTMILAAAIVLAVVTPLAFLIRFGGFAI
jgi:hypothetical protein